MRSVIAAVALVFIDAASRFLTLFVIVQHGPRRAVRASR